MRRLVIGLILIMGAALTASYQNCAPNKGTETGNPPGIDPSPAALRILAEICVKLAECHPTVTVDTCFARVKLTNTIDSELGLPVNYGSYQAIIDAESLGQLVADPSATLNCLTQIRQLGCQTPAMGGAYDSITPNDFSQVYQILPAGADTCEGVY